jgi:predicted adenine nucleotide alpha hydrolase (AANH) superfamily ATPase
MKVLLHICCAPCAIVPVGELLDEGHDVTGMFFNPNIHPFQEHQRRLETLREYADMVPFPVIWPEDYPLEEYLQAVISLGTERCIQCYRIRLDRTAETARAGGFDAFTSTLLYSRYQRHDQIREVAAEISSKSGVTFLYRDFREGWQEGLRKSRHMGLYRQPYCGCIFSEKERFYRPPRTAKQAASQEPPADRMPPGCG